jgi:hypothetical protein
MANSQVSVFDGMSGKEAAAYQLSEWVKGNPLHNPIRDECCPDFSCCRGKECMADKETRQRFAKADAEGDEPTRMEMLMMFLGNAFADQNVYVVGGVVEGSEQ